jgi:hypothetical protein
LADLLVIRLDNLSDGEVIGNFLNIKDFRLENHNTANEKQYNDIYQMFKDKFFATDYYINEMYHQKYAKHFYSQQEIKRLIKKYKK